MDTSETSPDNDPLAYYFSRHDKLSHKFSWHQQHTAERLLDLNGFISSISGTLEPERQAKDDFIRPLGFFEVEQPSRIRYTHLIFTFTIFERRARALCSVVRDCDPEISFDLKDLSGSFFEKLRLFCEKAAKLALPDPALWESIQKLQKVRDCIIHCGGCIRESRDADYIRKLISGGLGLHENSWGYLQVDSAYCEDTQNVVYEFLDALFSIAHTTLRKRLLARSGATEMT